jgi:hypothetical protein
MNAKNAKTAAAKTSERRASPGMKRLRAAPNAETIREAVLDDQATGRAAVVAEIEAAKATETPAKAPRARARPPRPPARPARAASAAKSSPPPNAASCPPCRNFSAATHARFRPKLTEVVALVEAGDIEGLRAYAYKGSLSSSPRAIMRYRDLSLVALEARAAA